MMQRYDYSNICKPLTKWQRRHLYMSSLLLWYSQRYFVAKLDVCSTEYPAQKFHDKKYEEKGRGEDFYGGGRRPGGWKGAINCGASFTKT